MSTATTPRLWKRIARSTTAAFSSGGKVRSIIRISPARTGYSSVARSMPCTAAITIASRSRSPPRLRLAGLKRTSWVVMRCERYPPEIIPWTARNTPSGLLWMSSVRW